MKHLEQPRITLATQNFCGGMLVDDPAALIPDFQSAQPAHDFFVDRLEEAAPDILLAQEVPVGSSHLAGFTVSREEESLAAKIEKHLGMESVLVACHKDHVAINRHDPNPGMLAVGIFWKRGLASLDDETAQIVATKRLPYPKFNMELPEEDEREGPAEEFAKYMLVMNIAGLIVANVHNQSASYCGFDYHAGEGRAYARQLDTSTKNTLLDYGGMPLALGGDLNAKNAARLYEQTFTALDLEDPRALVDAGSTRVRGSRSSYLFPNKKISVTGGGVIEVNEADHHITYIEAQVNYS